MINRLTIFLGPARLRALVLLLGITGLLSLILNAFDAAWVPLVQTLLMLAFIVGMAAIFISRMERHDQARWVALLLPALGALVLALFFLPQYQLALLGASAGWMVAGSFIFRARAPMQYQQAVKHLRRNEYADAVKLMDAVIKDEPGKAQHYRFRAEVLRVWGKLDRARRDYQKMTQLEPESAVAWNGLAEVQLQAGDYEAAHRAAERAYDLAPDEWVAVYNLGMIEDRLQQSDAAIAHLEKAVTLKVPDARHRLLVYLYLARAYSRLGDVAAAQSRLDDLKRHQDGLKEWQTILSSDQAETLRQAIGADVEAAEALINGDLEVMALAGSKT
jgi:tetratricopeptide (TPR) repeat protein